MSAIAQSVHIQASDLKRIRSYAGIAIPLSDILACELSVWLGCLLRFALQPWLPAGIGSAQYLGICAGVLMLPIVYLAAGLYPGHRIGTVQRLRSRAYLTALVFFVLLFWNYSYEHGQWSRGVLFGTMLFALILPPALEALVRTLLTRVNRCGMPAIMLGATPICQTVIAKLRKQPELGVIPIAVFDNDPVTWGTCIENVPVIGPFSAASDCRHQASLAIVTLPSNSRNEWMKVVEQLAFARVILVPDLPGLQSLWTVSRDIGGLLGIEMRRNLLLRKNRITKRILDYMIAGPLFLLSLPVIGLSIVCIKLISPGQAFFGQLREGNGGKSIRIWKLRTMYPNAEMILNQYLADNPDQKAIWARYFKLKSDPRILPVIGRFLRATSLDELPQLWNVLKGEMSLVGPRPFPRYHLNSFPEEFRELRATVHPGLTGLWQVSERSDGDVAVQEAHDTYYIRNWSVWLDVYIILRTFRTVLFPKGAY